MHLYCENVTLIHYSVVVIKFYHFYVSYYVCSNFEIWVRSVIRFENRDKAYKAQAHHLT